MSRKANGRRLTIYVKNTMHNNKVKNTFSFYDIKPNNVRDIVDNFKGNELVKIQYGHEILNMQPLKQGKRETEIEFE